MKKIFALAVLSLSLSACNGVVLPNTTTCTSAGLVSAGGICSETLSDATHELNFEEFIDMLEAQPERTCVPVPGMPVCSHDQSTGTKVLMPERGPSIIVSSSDYEKQKTALDQACRILRGRCSAALKKQIQAMEQFSRYTGWSSSMKKYQQQQILQRPASP